MDCKIYNPNTPQAFVTASLPAVRSVHPYMALQNPHHERMMAALAAVQSNNACSGPPPKYHDSDSSHTPGRSANPEDYPPPSPSPRDTHAPWPFNGTRSARPPCAVCGDESHDRSTCFFDPPLLAYDAYGPSLKPASRWPELVVHFMQRCHDLHLPQPIPASFQRRALAQHSVPPLCPYASVLVLTAPLSLPASLA